MASLNQMLSISSEGFAFGHHSMRTGQLGNVRSVAGVQPVQADKASSLNDAMNAAQNPYKNYSEYLQAYAREKTDFETGLKGVASQLGAATDQAEQWIGRETLLDHLNESTRDLEMRREIAKEAAKEVAKDEQREARREAMEAERAQQAEARQAEIEQQQEEMREAQAEQMAAPASEESREDDAAANRRGDAVQSVAEENAAAVLQSVQQLVQGYNDATDFLESHRDVSGKVSALADGFTRQREGDDLPSRLAEVGINVGETGRLSVDVDRLSSSLKNNPDAVGSTLGRDGLSGRAKTQIRRMDFQMDRLFPGPESKLQDTHLSGSKQLYTPPKTHQSNPLKTGNFVDMSY